MLASQRCTIILRIVRLGVLFALPTILAVPVLAGEKKEKTEAPALSKIISKLQPESLEELRVIQKQVADVVKKVTPAVVGVRIGAGQGSGVIISEDGYILTAGHVSGDVGRKVAVILPDGKIVKGKTLGRNRGVDSGLIKITTKGKWPHVKIGDSTKLKRGHWCIAIGHPKGYIPGRTPVVRLGRVLHSTGTFIRTNCALVGGDSGGPLFDFEGNVIGIHSRIGPKITFNIHVPAKVYNRDWDRLAKGEVFPALPTQAWLGVTRDEDAKDCRLAEVKPNSPAAKAGIKVNDVIVQFGGKKISTFDDLRTMVLRMKPGRRVDVVVLRGEDRVTLKLTIGKRRS